MQINRVISLKLTEQGSQVRAHLGISYDGTGLLSNSREFVGPLDAVMWASFLFLKEDRERLEQLQENPQAPERLVQHDNVC